MLAGAAGDFEHKAYGRQHAAQDIENGITVAQSGRSLKAIVGHVVPCRWMQRGAAKLPQFTSKADGPAFPQRMAFAKADGT
jgi:hypothetical protein